MNRHTLVVIAALSISGVALAGEPDRKTIDFSQVVVEGEARRGVVCGGWPQLGNTFERLFRVRTSFIPELLASAPNFESPAPDDLDRSPLRVRIVPAASPR